MRSDVPVIGLNCATGPHEMAEHVKWLGENWPRLISVQPNAGLPELVDGHAQYPLVAGRAGAVARALCARGRRQHHRRLLRHRRARISPRSTRCCAASAATAPAPGPNRAAPAWAPSVASLYGQVALRQENAYLSIGERCNANGSRAFRRMQEQGDWDGCVEMGREQVKEGSHTLDLCTAFVGRDEIADMTEMVTRMRGAVNAPLVIEFDRIPGARSGDAALWRQADHQLDQFRGRRGRGRQAAETGAPLRRRGHRADDRREAAWPRRSTHKIAVARRLYDFACVKHGLPAGDLLFDPLTFTICTGNEDDRKLGLNTLDAIERIAQELPECQIMLGLSNISFGFNPPARQVLNSVFLDHALRRGMTGAIVHFSRILPLHRIPRARSAGRRGFDLRPPARGLRPAAGLYRAVRGPHESKRPRRRAGRKQLEERLA